MAIDHSSLGFRCGLEIHQQLEGRKLFCRCPTLNSDAQPDIKLERVLRAVAGETGEVDIAARHEMSKEKRISYIGNSSDVCLVELDEDPPHEVNLDAVKAALQIAMLLHSQPVDEIRFMRKTVVDGSNVSGFQRTALVATDGFIETKLGKVRIATICLEEEAAQKVKESKDSITYRLDRLGIPLIEIGTDADIKSPEQAKEAAAFLGMVLRSVPGVKRGLGTIRQDVNVS
ncbi:Glu-tRNA(Gln) amidotransferase GatDE subunit E, partial [Candidatus Woesearchaeota archaeon]|nr:Glu-tRNA(Gln) amidotransferase GatDE subunit E [Candidatus Woesearchaeota archaeon]